MTRAEVRQAWAAGKAMSTLRKGKPLITPRLRRADTEGQKLAKALKKIRINKGD